MLFKNIARAFLKHVGNAVGFGVVGDLAIDVWDSWSKEGKDQQQKLAEVQELAQQSAAETRQEAQAVALEVAGDQPEEVRLRLQTYLTQVPAMVRRSLRRPADPTGMTIPSGLAMTKPEDLLTFLPAKPSHFKSGDRPLLGVDWELVELLGAGGFGEVWKARNPYFDGVPPVALKFCLDPEASRTLREASHTLKHEAAVLNQVMRQGKHAGIVQLQHSYLSANPPCLEYEYVQGGDLTGLIHDWHRSGIASAEKVAGVMLQLAEIVGFAHRLDPPIVHRDLKPANILLEQRQGGGVQLKVADFGIGGVAASQAIKEAAKGLPEGMMMTAIATGTFTPLYASPQQTSGRAADPRDDVYALGIIWYQMLTGDLNAGRPGGARWRQKATERGMKPELVDLLERCFEEYPEDRPRDAAELAERLKLDDGDDVEDPGNGGRSNEMEWREKYPGALDCAIWYRELLTRFHRDVPMKFGKTAISLFVGGRVLVAVKPLKAPRAYLKVKYMQGNAEATEHLTRAGVAFVPKDNLRLVFHVDIQELKASQAAHEWLAEHLLAPVSSQPSQSAIDQTMRNNSEEDEEDDDSGGTEDDKGVGQGLSDEKEWREKHPGALSCALWYREVLTRFHQDVPIKFGKTSITLYVGGMVRVSLKPRKPARARLVVRPLEGNATAADYLSRERIAFVPKNDKRLIFNVDLQELKASQAAHEWLAQHLLGGTGPVVLPDREDEGTSFEGSSEGSAAILKKFREGLLSRPRMKATRHANLSARDSSGIGIGAGVRGLSLNYVVGQDKGRVELNITRGTGKGEENKRIFDRLREHKAEIDAAFGTELSWQRLDQKQASRIEYITQGGYKSDEAKWPEIQDAMIDAMIRLDKAVSPFLAKLKDDLA